MSSTLARAAYADMFGPTTGDKLRLADTQCRLRVSRAARQHPGSERHCDDEPAAGLSGHEFFGASSRLKYRL